MRPEDEAALAEHQEARENDGWIEWRGANCPVGLDTMVEVKLRLGRILAGQAIDLRWDWEGENSSTRVFDIIAYRAVSAPAIDPRDARIAQLEEGLRTIARWARSGESEPALAGPQCSAIYHLAVATLEPARAEGTKP